jgi:hypothetical protein
MRNALTHEQLPSTSDTQPSMKITSVRIPEHHHEYSEKIDKNISTVFRDALQTQYQNDMAGVCAATGNPVFFGDGHTTVQQTTPIGNKVLSDTSVAEIDLCAEAAAVAYEALSTPDRDSQSSPPVTLSFLNRFTPYQYQALRHMLVDNDGRHGIAGIVPQEFVSYFSDAQTLALTVPREVLLATLLDWTTWEPEDKLRSQTLETRFTFTVETAFTQFSSETINDMYQHVLIGDLIDDGVIPAEPPTSE